MENTKKTLVRLMNEEEGQNMIEYALVAGIIAVGAIVAMTAFKNQIATAFNSVGSQLANAV